MTSISVTGSLITNSPTSLCNPSTQRIVVLLKPLIIFLLIGVLISLFSGLLFLFQDVSEKNSKRTLYALGIRITLAGALMVTLVYGVWSGQLRIGTNAPWHREAPPAAQADP